MNRRVTGTLGLTAAAVIGSTFPAWAFWTLSSDPASVAAAKATQLNGANVEARKTGGGNNATITIRIGPGPGAFPDRFTVYRGPDLICSDVPSTQTCTQTDSNNSGDKIYTITAYAGTNWVSAVSTCSFKPHSDNPIVAESIRCARLPSTLTGSSSPAISSGGSDLTAPGSSRSAPASTSTPTPTPTPTPNPSPTPIPEPAPADPTGPVESPEPEAAEPAESAPADATSAGPGTQPG